MPTNTSDPYKPPHKAATPRRAVFDPWNTSSKGHQHAENRLAGSTSWRTSRTLKINDQFISGAESGGGRRIADTVGAGSTLFGEDGRTETGWDNSVKGSRGRQGLAGQGWGDIAEMMKVDESRKRKREVKLQDNGDEDDHDNDMPPPSAQQPRIETESDVEEEDEEEEEDNKASEEDNVQASKTSKHNNSSSSSNIITQDPTPSTTKNNSTQQTAQQQQQQKPPPQIFSSLTILINGTTYPTISDHKLKYLLTSHGAHLSLTHARRQVTHVITGRACSSSSPAVAPTPAPVSTVSTVSSTVIPPAVACGGGLSARKLAKDISQTHGSSWGASKGVRYVSVEWVLESVKAGRRLSEARFPGVNVAPRGVRSVRDMFGMR